MDYLMANKSIGIFQVVNLYCFEKFEKVNQNKFFELISNIEKFENNKLIGSCVDSSMISKIEEKFSIQYL